MRLATGISCIFFAGLLAAQTTSSAGPQQGEPPSQPDYTGPVILSRGGGPVSGGSTELMKVLPFASVTAVYDTGLTGFFTDTQGRLPADSAYGVQATFGAVGRHAWRRTTLAVDYRGTLRHYSRRNYHDGLDQQLEISLSHRLSRRVGLTLIETAASRQWAYLGMGGNRYYDPNFSALADDLLFDTRTYLAASSARLTFEKSNRLSFSMAGSGSLMEPRSRGLVRVRGFGSHGDVAYRLTRRQTIAGDYVYQHFEYPNAFGGADIHSAGVVYGNRLSRHWDLGLVLGGYRVETLRLQAVRIDPVIAAMIGQRMGVEAFHRILYMPRIDAQLIYRFRTSSLTAGYARGLSPGNGLYLASSTESARVTYSYTGMRRLHLSITGGSTRYSSLAQTLGRLRQFRGGGGLTYRLAGPLSFIARFDARTYNIQGSGFQRTYYRTSAGVAFSPGEVPLALW